MLKTIEELNLGYSDAQNYSQRSNKQMFSEIFVKNSFLTKLIKSSTYYLIGEKGTGKTAYAVYLSNSEYEGNKSILKFISGTDYEKFYELKKTGRIDISGYVDIWKAILLLLLSKSVAESDKVVSPFNKSNIADLNKAVDKYYNEAFSPEIINALKIVDKSAEMAELVCKYAKIGASQDSMIEFNEQKLQMNLYYITQNFSDALGKLKLVKNVTLYIDGIDVRPSQIPYDDYLECVKGLANACWALNSELFANTKDSKGQFKVVLLLRPDIFNSLNLQNSTNKLVDNAVYLDWGTTYTEYPSSKLYAMANRLLSYDQLDISDDNIWDTYFDWLLPSTNKVQREHDKAFMEFLKISLSRPRDIQRILSLIQEIMLDSENGNNRHFSYNAYTSNRFQNAYSEYFLSSLKDQLSFYYSEEDYRHFKKFFEFFNEPEFTYDEYHTAYEKYVEYILDNAKEIPKFVEDPKEFLQLLYDSNIIAAIEPNGKFFHFSYREKSITNIAPEVLYDNRMSYRFHYGLYKKTRMGRY